MPEMMQDVPVVDEDEIRDIADDLVEKGAIPDAEGYVRDRTYDLGLGVEVIPGSQKYDERVGWVEDVRLPSGKIVSHLIPRSHGYQEWEDPGLWVGAHPDEGPSGGPKLAGVEPLGGFDRPSGIMAPGQAGLPGVPASDEELNWFQKVWGWLKGLGKDEEPEELDYSVIVPREMFQVMHPDGTVTFHDYKSLEPIDEVTAMEMYADYQAGRPTGMSTVARWEVVEDQGERFYVGYDAQGNIIETQYLGSAPTAGMTEWQKEQLELAQQERIDRIKQERRRQEIEREQTLWEREQYGEMSEYQEGMLELQRQEFEWRQQQDGQLTPWQEEQLRLSREQLEWQKEQYGTLTPWQESQIGFEERARQLDEQELAWRKEQFGQLSAWQEEQLRASREQLEFQQQQFGELSAWQEAQIGLEQQQFEEMSAWQEAQMGLAEKELGLEQQRYEAQLAAQPHSWLEYSMVAGEQPVVQPWMLPLMPQEYEGMPQVGPLGGAQAQTGGLGQEMGMWTGQGITQPTLPAPTGYQPPAVSPTILGGETMNMGGYDPYALPAGYEVAIPETGGKYGGYKRFATATGIPSPLSTGGAATIGTTARGLMIPSDELLAMIQPSYDLSIPEQKEMALEMWYRQNITPQGWAARMARAKGDSAISQFARARGIPIENMALLAPPGGRRPIQTPPRPSAFEAEALPAAQVGREPRGRYTTPATPSVSAQAQGYMPAFTQTDSFGVPIRGTTQPTPTVSSYIPPTTPIVQQPPIPEYQQWMGGTTTPTQTPQAGGQVGQPIPGWSEPEQMPKLRRPSRQYQARMGPTALGQYGGYEQFTTGIRPEELEFRLWSMAPPGGRHRGLSYVR